MDVCVCVCENRLCNHRTQNSKNNEENPAYTCLFPPSWVFSQEVNGITTDSCALPQVFQAHTNNNTQNLMNTHINIYTSLSLII